MILKKRKVWNTDMIYPSINELLANGKINRYTLVVATAKCARIITDEYVKQREYAEKLALSKDFEKKGNFASMIKREYRDEKAVKNAITGLYSGEFKIIMPNGDTVMLGGAKNADDGAAENDEPAGETAERGETVTEREEAPGQN